MNTSFDFSTSGKYRAIGPSLSKARFALIDRVIATAAPVGPAEAAALVGGHEVLAELISLNIIGLDASGDVGYLYPVSAHPTGHRVRLADGREFDTMCAIDSLGCAGTFGADADIFSFCKDTGEKVHIRVERGEIALAEPGADLFVSYYDSWTDGSFNF